MSVAADSRLFGFDEHGEVRDLGHVVHRKIRDDYKPMVAKLHRAYLDAGLAAKGIVETTLRADGDLLSEAERAEIAALQSDLLAKAQVDDAAANADAIDAAVQALAKGTEAFAAARMNRGIQQALTGRSIDQV